MLLADRSYDINSYDLDEGNLTIRSGNLLAYQPGLSLKQSIIPGFLTLIGTGKFVAASNGAVHFVEPPIRVDPQALVGWADCPSPCHHYDHAYLRGVLGGIRALTGIGGASGEEHQFEFVGAGQVLLQSTEIRARRARDRRRAPASRAPVTRTPCDRSATLAMLHCSTADRITLMETETADGVTTWLTEDEQRAWRIHLDVSRLLMYQLERDLQPFGLTNNDYEILVNLSEAEDRRMRMSDLARSTLQSKSRLSHQITRMETAGLVRRENCESDRRGLYAVLTEQGWDDDARGRPAACRLGPGPLHRPHPPGLARRLPPGPRPGGPPPARPTPPLTPPNAVTPARPARRNGPIP